MRQNRQWRRHSCLIGSFAKHWCLPIFGYFPRGGFRDFRLFLIDMPVGRVGFHFDLLKGSQDDGELSVGRQHAGVAFGGDFLRLLHFPKRSKAQRVVYRVQINAVHCPFVNIDLKQSEARCDVWGHVDITLTIGSPVVGHRPSINILFNGARYHALRAIGALLADLERGGAVGRLVSRQEVSGTIGQDFVGSSAHGKPKMDLKLGSVQIEQSIDSIRQGILSGWTRGLST